MKNLADIIKEEIIIETKVFNEAKKNLDRKVENMEFGMDWSEVSPYQVEFRKHEYAISLLEKLLVKIQ